MPRPTSLGDNLLRRGLLSAHPVRVPQPGLGGGTAGVMSSDLDIGRAILAHCVKDA